MAETYKIGDLEYRISRYVKVKRFGELPVVEIPTMSDYDWQRLCLESRLEHPELYRATEDVEATIKRLRKWLSERRPS